MRLLLSFLRQRGINGGIILLAMLISAGTYQRLRFIEARRPLRVR